MLIAVELYVMVTDRATLCLICNVLSCDNAVLLCGIAWRAVTVDRPPTCDVMRDALGYQKVYYRTLHSCICEH